MKNKIIDKYGSGILTRSALNLKDGYEDLVYFLSKRKIKTAVEIGTFRGLTSCVISQYCDNLITIDIENGLVENYETRQLVKKYPRRKAIWKELDITNIRQVIINNNQEKADLLKDIEYDFVFIDGDHSYEGVKYDYELVKECNQILFHDYDRREGKSSPVRDFIDTLEITEHTKDFAYVER